METIGDCLIWHKMPRKEEFPKAVITGKSVVFLQWRETSRGQFSKNGRCETDTRVLFGKRGAKISSARGKHEDNLSENMHFFGKRRLHIKTIQEHAILWLSTLTCTQMPRFEKLLLLRVIAELLALSLVIWGGHFHTFAVFLSTLTSTWSH